MSPFGSVGRGSLLGLADALDTGRLGAPYTVFSLRRWLAAEQAGAVAAELERLGGAGMQPAHLAYLLRALAEEQEQAQRASDRIELVWTGPETPGSASRDTGVVVRELFASAERSVLVAGFVVYQGRDVFRVLAERMDALPSLVVRMFLNVSRPAGDDTTPDAQLLAAFADRFRRHEWPGRRLPQIFYDPRALSARPGPRAVLHAKCVVVDGERSLVTSANFTEAAQQRNIEAGALVADPAFARALQAQLETLASSGVLRRVAGMG
ncbi:MAG: phospholipase [Deltaproteobacteria bacterium]|nr:phospholipase [Deltaproteobacteria bacterium]